MNIYLYGNVHRTSLLWSSYTENLVPKMIAASVISNSKVALIQVKNSFALNFTSSSNRYLLIKNASRKHEGGRYVTILAKTC